MVSLSHVMLGFVISLIIAIIAFKREMLSDDGIIGALILGTIIFGFAGWTWFAVLVAFFLSSSLITKYKARQKRAIEAEFAKGGRRDFLQVLANGTAGAGAALANVLWPSPLWVYGFAGAIATVTADTWATELGILANKKPRMLPWLREARAGESGAVSWQGEFFAAAGALSIGLTLALTSLLDIARTGAPVALEAWLDWSVPLIVIATVAGVAGTLADSLFGATVQATYYCPRHRKETENPVHRCGVRCRFRRGFAWMDNDVVNLLASVTGALLGVGLARALGLA
jgi:uncharacterized protein (TIGR00297 family)